MNELKVGDKLMVEYGGEFYKATVVGIKTDNVFVKINFGIFRRTILTLGVKRWFKLGEIIK